MLQYLLWSMPSSCRQILDFSLRFCEIKSLLSRIKDFYTVTHAFPYRFKYQKLKCEASITFESQIVKDNRVHRYSTEFVNYSTSEQCYKSACLNEDSNMLFKVFSIMYRNGMRDDVK